ncbi:MAG TPA: hypothetical protein VEK15_09940, partial [Vicinamibacteria bacterium]|nr:hypothetical protein [Vicinamibacteria bacterium]
GNKGSSSAALHPDMTGIAVVLRAPKTSVVEDVRSGDIPHVKAANRSPRASCLFGTVFAIDVD